MRILHFSDFHLAKDGVEQSKLLVDRMIDAVKNYPICEPIDAIVFTGDMIDKGGRSFASSEEAYRIFHETVVCEMCRRLGITESMFFAVPGNHEVNRNLTDKENDLKLEETLISSEAIHNHLIAPENKGYSERLGEYDQFYRQPWQAQGVHEIHTTVQLADHFIINSDGREIGVSLLNSAWRCGPRLKKVQQKNDKGIAGYFKNVLNTIRGKQKHPIEEILHEDNLENRTLVGDAQITNAVSFFRERDIKYKIGLLHHHYSLLAEPDDDDIERALQKNYTICFCGHKHRAKSEKTEIDDEIIIATAPGVIRWNIRSDSQNKNGFSVWDIDFSSEKASEIQFIQGDGQDFEPIIREDGSIVRPWYWNLRRHLQDFHTFFRNRAAALSKDISSAALDDMCNRLKDDKNNTLVLYGLPGLGKTHIIHKTFNNYKSEDLFSQISVTEVSSEPNFQLRDELKKYFTEFNGKNACIVIDNTSLSAFTEVMRIRDDSYSDVKLIGVMNHCDFQRLNRYGIPTLELKTEFTREAIDAYVDKRITDMGMRQTVKTISDGFPFVAIKVVEKLLKSGITSKRDAYQTLAHSRYVIDEELRADSELYEMLCAMAIFKPFPKLEKDSMALWKSKHLSSLYDKSLTEIVQLIDRAKRLWHGEIVENSESGYSIRPYLVASWLAESWFEKHDDPETYIGLLNDIAALPEYERRITFSCLEQRLANMNECAFAKELLKKLTSEGGVFRCEDVVYSELGSQLVLAMSNVNPLEVSEALREIIISSTPERIKALHYMVRRNIVFTLTNTLFYDESFEASIVALGTLALIETENNISNNSRGIFTTVFHIFLSGTQASLEKRVNWLKSINIDNSSLAELIPIAVQSALSAGTFVHTGHIGPNDSVQRDYNPTNTDIQNYWDECCKIATEEIEEGKNIGLYQETIENNLRLWTRSGVVMWILPLIKAMANSENSEWSMLESDFNDVVDELKTKDVEAYRVIESLRSKIVRSDFFARLKSCQKDFYSAKKNFSEPEDEIHFFDSLAKEFIDDKAYKDSGLIDQLLLSTDFVCWAFCANLSNRISEEVLTELYGTISTSQHLTDDVRSPFLSTLCSLTRNRESTRQFLNNLQGKRMYSLYTRMMARTEDDELSHLKIIHPEANGEYDFLPDYLNNVSLTNPAKDGLVKFIDDNFHVISNKDEAVHFIITHCWHENLSETNLALCKSILLKYSPDDNSGWVTRDILRFATSLLEQSDDYDFVLAFHQRVIGYGRENVDTYGVAEFYKHALNKYPDKILESVLLAMVDSKYDSAARVLVQELGTGMGFSEGVLFQIDDKLLLEQLSKYGLPLARLYGEMCPIFGEGDTFSEWVYRLLDEYGSDDEVRSAISCNMGSYAWSGSVVSLHKRKIGAFSKLLTHVQPKVREWAETHMKQEKKDLNQETLREDLMHQLYR